MKVAHFVRKRSQLDSSFIFNQILNHQKFSPVIFFGYDDHVHGVADFPINKYKFYDLKWKESFLDKLFWLFLRPTPRKSQILKRLVREEQPDILHFHYGSDAGLFLPILKNLVIPSIVSFYGYDCTGFPGYYSGMGKNFLKSRVFKNATIITAMSHNMKYDLIHLGCNENKINVHYHGINTKLFNYSNNLNESETVSFIIISSLTPQKGHIFLLNSFKKASQENKKIKLTIVGDGNERHIIERHISSMKLTNVFLQKAVKFASEEHIRYLSEADVFIHPSVTDDNGNKEGIPGAIVEAMTMGLPVISTCHAGIPEVIKHMHTGILVRENDSDQLAEAICRLAKDSMLRKTLGQNAKEYALTLLDVCIKEKELESLYLNIIR